MHLQLHGPTIIIRFYWEKVTSEDIRKSKHSKNHLLFPVQSLACDIQGPAALPRVPVVPPHGLRRMISSEKVYTTTTTTNNACIGYLADLGEQIS
mmetsp:Transcript_72519/g.132829  ORF Transcript_72519/g.132829 Transcript_72519/m.132829 type:complete len:95 (-) Transcript_72519:444-728(-)